MSNSTCMRAIKTLAGLFLALFIVLFINGCIYVFALQDWTMNKIQKGEDISLYEKMAS